MTTSPSCAALHKHCGGIMLLVLLLVSHSALARTQLSEAPWGTLADGTPVTRYTLTNAAGARASFMAFGAAILELQAPDRAGTLGDVVLGFDSAAEYQSGNGAYIGLTVGRYASRIFGTALTLDGTTHTLTAQPGRDGTPGTVVLHGGPQGFSSRLWTASPVSVEEGDAIRFTLVSPDGDQGFPGELQASVTYRWSDDFRLQADYEATTSKTTVLNLTQHSYFNLAGAGNGDILQHLLRINADFFTFALPDNRPTGEIVSVTGTPFDFTSAKPIAQDIDSEDAQMRANRGYNQNFVLRAATIAGQLAEAAVLQDLESGRRLTLWTTEPGLFLLYGELPQHQPADEGRRAVSAAGRRGTGNGTLSRLAQPAALSTYHAAAGRRLSQHYGICILRRPGRKASQAEALTTCWLISPKGDAPEPAVRAAMRTRSLNCR